MVDDTRPDSPKCPECMKTGIISQTYKVAALPFYLCTTCGMKSPISQFDDIDLQWKTNPKEWEKLHNMKLNKGKLGKVKHGA